MKVYANLSGPPPCDACGSTEHGHIQLAPFEIACPEGVIIPPGLLHVIREPTGALKLRAEVEKRAPLGFSIEGKKR